MEKQSAKKEADDDASSANHRHNGNHGAGKAQGIEVGEVGRAQEEADADDAPVPTKRSGVLMGGPPQNGHHQAHHAHLVEVVPRLHGHAVDAHSTIGRIGHEILVVEPADGAEYGCQHNESYPTVVLEVDAFLLARTAQHEEGADGQQYTDPLPHVEALAKHQ